MSASIERASQTRCCLPLEQWPEADTKAWHAAIEPASLFDEPGMGANWAPATMAGVRRGYGRWLLWSSNTTQGYAETAPADRVTRPAIAKYVAFLRTTTADTSASAYISFLHSAVRAMTPDRDWAWMKKIYMRLKQDAPVVRQKRHRLRSTTQLFDLGLSLVTEADPGLAEPTLAQALQYRDGLIVALLAVRPLRAKNFTALALGETLVERSGSFWISFGREAMKTHATEQPFPAPLVDHLMCYLDHIRPYLMARRHSRPRRQDVRPPGTALWISADGGPLSRNAFFDLVSNRTAARFGLPVNPHLFRDCLATTIATETPDEVGSTRRLLGHASLLTSERHYNHADGLKASKRVQDHIRALRQRNKVDRTRRSKV